MTAPSWELQQAIHALIAGNAEIVALLGGARVYDDVPQRAELPYLTVGQSVVRDWSTGTEGGAEHLVTLHVWSRAGGRREVQAIMGVVRDALHDQPLTLTGHRLVNLRHETSDARRESDGETYHGIIRFRAVTEPTA